MRHHNNSRSSGRPRPYLALACLSVLALPSALAAAPGVTEDSIIFGQTACFSGPSSQLGIRINAGIQAAFWAQNRNGGVDGRRLELIAEDDGYEPEAAAKNAAAFAEQDNVLAVIGGVGTPTARRSAPILRDAKIPFIGMFTGADFLQDSQKFPNVVNLRTSYLREVEALVEHMINEMGKKRFGVIYQDDAFGRSVLANYVVVLNSYDLPVLAKSAYSRNTHAVHSSLFTLDKADLDAVLLVGSYTANADVINLAFLLGREYVMANLSFVAPYDLLALVSDKSPESLANILVSQVVPDVNETSLALVRNFRRDIINFDSSSSSLKDARGPEGVDLIDAVSLEGYIIGRFVIDVVDRLDGDLERDRLLEVALQAEPVQIDDWTIQVAPGTNSGSSYVRLIDWTEEGGHDH